MRRCGQGRARRDGVYWELVESCRTERVVACPGDVSEKKRVGVQQAARRATGPWQSRLFDEEGEPEWVEVDTRRVRVERVRDFGGCWLGLQVWERLGLMRFLGDCCQAEHLYERNILADLLGIPTDKVNDDRIYRALDRLLPHKVEVEKHLKGRMGELFDLEYDLLLYDVTSTYFEGECAHNEQARRGYPQDHRAGCKQVCVALVVTREGVPLGYEVFAGNRADVTTVEDTVERTEVNDAEMKMYYTIPVPPMAPGKKRWELYLSYTTAEGEGETGGEGGQRKTSTSRRMA